MTELPSDGHAPTENKIDWFRRLLVESRKTEETDPAPILSWLDEARKKIGFTAELIGLDEVEGWNRDAATGNISHRVGEFFSIEGVRITAGSAREVSRWDQPIFNQKEGGILALVAQRSGTQIRFLLNAKAEPGNIGTLQLAPSIQCTWSNLNRAHQGRLPPLAELLDDGTPCTSIYEAFHNEEGGRFWRKSNSNRLLLVESDVALSFDSESFVWASLTQIKALALVDNVLSPFVKTIIAPF